MENKEEEKIEEDIKEGLDFLEKKIDIITPDIESFRKMINQVDFNKEKKTKKEVVIFIFVAAITLCLETYAFNQSVLFFIILQSLAGTSFVIGLVNWAFRSRKVKAI